VESAKPNASRGGPRKVCQVSGLEPTVGGQRGQVAQLLGGSSEVGQPKVGQKLVVIA
jgi:hypothetical protein